MENIATDPLPPLPEQSHSRQAQSGIQPMELRSRLVSPPSNSWRILPEEIPVDAERVRPVQAIPEAKIGSSFARSPFRRGKMTLDSEGFTLQGVGHKPIPWLRNVSIGATIFFLFSISVTIMAPLPTTTQRLLIDSLVVCFFISLLALVIESVINERLRAPIEIRVPWSQVKGMQSSILMTWAVLIYCEPSTKPKCKEAFLYFSINSLSPAVLAALQDAVEAYAPGILPRAIDKEVWTTGKLIAVAVLLIIIAVAGSIVFQNMNH